MRKLFLLAGMIISVECLQAQPGAPEETKGTIQGKVLDFAGRAAIEYATITLFPAGSNKPVNGTTTNKKGEFTLTGIDDGKYTLVAEFIGYRPDSLHGLLISPKNPRINLPGILLTKKGAMLQEVTVTAKTPLIENKIDKLVYNAEKDITAQSGVATDVLKKIPQISVDIDGNVELQGNSNIRFLINGKPSSIFGNNLSDALQSIPASQIKSIEVITSPGAKYDAEGTGGIINIILKESHIRGINGNVNISGGSRLQNGSLNLNAREGSFGAHAFFSGNAFLTSRTYTNLHRTSTDSAKTYQNDLWQDGNNEFYRNGFETGMGVDWAINKKNSVSASFGYDHFTYNSQGFNNQQQTNQYLLPPGPPVSLQQSILNSHSRSQFYSRDYSLSYKKTFDREEQELNFLYDHSEGSSRSLFSQYQTDFHSDSVFSGLQTINPGTDHETEISLDYAQPLKENLKLETGAKAAFRNIGSVSDVYSFYSAPDKYHYDSTQSNSLNYKRQVYALYASLSFKAFSFLDIKTGLRYERTETSAYFSKAASTVIPGYNTLAPSLVFSHKFPKEQTLRLSYTHRIQRPGYRLLNPYVNASDPKNISQGNPYLNPEIGNNIELGYNRSFDKGANINLSLYYRGSNHDIQPYVVFYPTFMVGDSLYQNVSVSTFQNIGMEDIFGFSLYGSVPVGSKVNLRSNLQLFDKYIMNRFVSGATINSFNYRINVNASWQVNSNLVMEFFGNFNSPRNEVQGKYPSFTTYNFAFRKQFWNKKGSFGFTCTNPFNKFVAQRTELFGTDFVLNSLRQIPFRSFGLSFALKFGKLEFKKEKEESGGNGAPENN